MSMEFRLLGPLEVHGASGLVPLGGTRQRAALAYLLLHAGQVVSTRRLLSAVWATDRTPDTARKILQNTIWRLRRALAPVQDGRSPQLLTRAPGYVVRVPPDHIDLVRFERLAARGRSALLSGDLDQARAALRETLALWRGPALADLAEEGTAWPELVALEQKRLDAMEDRFEVELRCGQTRSMLVEMDAYTRSEPLRERAAGQLMLALYRCGRRADALGVYARTRTALTEGLGLEPGHELRRLQQAILTQDSSLDPPRTREPATLTPARHKPKAKANDERPARAHRTATPTVVPLPYAGRPAAAKVDGHPVDDRGGHRKGSVLLLRFTLGRESDRLPAADVDRGLDAACELARAEIVRGGGSAATAIGSVLLGFFQDAPGHEDCAERAVRSALAVRARLRAPAALALPVPVVGALSVHAAVATGTAFVRRRSLSAARGRAPWIGGDLVDRSETMLHSTPPGEIRVCDATWRIWKTVSASTGRTRADGAA